MNFTADLRLGRVSCVAAAFCLLLVGPGFEARGESKDTPAKAVTSRPAVGADSLRARQQAQQRARLLARDLVTTVLNVQLQQLRENRLESLPIYTEIESMQKNINQLVDTEMQAVVELLARGQEGTRAEREEIFKQSRGMIRTIVVKLSIERQNLLRRLKTAEIAAQVKRLIELETVVLKTTTGMPELPPAQREQVALKTIEDQRDIHELYKVLEQVLADVTRWGGAVGTGATDGLKILAEANVPAELTSADTTLSASQFADAAGHQTEVLRGLKLLLKRIEQVQGLLNTERQTALDRVKGLIDKQEQVRQETQKARPDESEKLVEKQAEIRKELNKLAQAIPQDDKARQLLEQAKEAAYDATGKIFDGKPEEAAAEQSKVIGNLAQIEQELLAGTPASESDKSADELAEQMDDLKHALADVEKLQTQQAEAEKKPAAEAATQEQAISAEVAKVDDNRDLPAPVDAALARAEQATAEAAKELAKPAPTPQDQSQQAKAMKAAADELAQARAEIKTALADTERKQLAVKIGELARASESLERAAAAERDIANEAGAAAKDQGLTPEAAQALKSEQAEIDAVAAKVAEGVKSADPQTAAALENIAKQGEQIGQELAGAKDQPGEASKPAAQKAADQAGQNARQLEQAAADLREQAAKTADQLAKLAAEQRVPVAAARQDVENALTKPEENIAERLANLEAAKNKIAEAQSAQQRAAGRPEAAAAMDLAREIAKAAAAQEKAGQTANNLNNRNEASPAQAAAQEQAVAEAVQALQKEAEARPAAKAAKEQGQPDQLAAQLETAKTAAKEAAQATVERQADVAEQAREKAAKALEKAGELARAEVAAAMQAPAGQPDVAAQKQVAESAAQAEELAQADAPAAAKALDAAEQAAGDAAAAAEQAQPEKTAAAQAQAEQKLAEAAAQVDKAKKQLATEAQKQLAEKAAQADQLAGKAAEVDAQANMALNQAENAAAEAAGEPDITAPEAMEAGQENRRGLERAAASLQTREQQLERDQAVAEAIAEAAREQQQAAEQIAEAREALPASGVPTPPEAKKLASAAQKFAESQRTAGQGAAQVSGQDEIANPPLREALELASNLGQDKTPPPPANAPPGEPQEPAKGTGQEKPPAGSPEGTPSGEGSGEGSPSGQTPPSDPALGTGVVPNSPEVTAEMKAGKAALDAALAQLDPHDADASAADANSSKAPSKAAQAKKSDDPKSKAAAQAQGAKSSQRDTAGKNPERKNGLDNSDVPNPDEGVGPPDKNGSTESVDARKLEDEAWFARLPPELRDAMKAKSQRRAPRAYEERLRRYFESID